MPLQPDLGFIARPNRLWRHLCMSLGTVMLAPAAFAQPVPPNLPDAGSLLREIESTMKMPYTQPAFLPEVPPAMEDKGVKIVLKSVVIKGYEGLLTEQEIATIRAPFIGQEMGFNGMNRVVASFTQALKNKGFFLSFAYLPEQDVSSGELLILIQPGKVDGAIEIDYFNPDNTTVLMTETRIEGMLESKLGKISDAPLQAVKIEEAMLTINDLSGISAALNLEKGSQPGTTKVKLDLNSTPRFSGVAWADNYGSYYTGRERVNALGFMNNVTGKGDQASVMLSASQNQVYGRLAYQTPFGYAGTKLNVGVTLLEYELGEELKSSGYSGESRVVNLGLVHPISRSRLGNLYGEVGLDWKEMTDEAFAQGTTISEVSKEREFVNLSLRLRGDGVDQLLGGGMNQWSVGMTLGDLKLTSAASDDFGTNGSFSKYDLSASRLQKVTPQFNVYFQASAQFSDDNLDSGEKFSIGGAQGVRAYPSGEASGDEGALFSLEGRYTVPDFKWQNSKLELKAFYDTGRVTLSKEGFDGYNPANTNGVNELRLSGAGLGATLTHPSGKELSLFWAQGLNDDVNDRTITGKDSEAKTNDSRFGLQFKAWF
jgi:hemolysin activation/secretion protein